MAIDMLSRDQLPDYFTVGGRSRCWWCEGHDDYIAYHDDEWGLPCANDQRLFEKICLEGFQSGLSWLTVLRKRECFREHFRRFDFRIMASFDETDISRMLADAGIIRHRKKIESAINNARRAMDMSESHGSLAAFFWRFEPDPSNARAPASRRDIQSVTPESTAMAGELKRMGWTFVGPTTCYAFMQSMGMVNDHLAECHCWSRIEAARQSFHRPRA